MEMTPRRYDFDWLRIGAVLLLFPYHTARIFDSVPYFYIKSNSVVQVLDLLARFVEQWHMPLFFVLAGAASWYALNRRSARAWLSERCQRLLVPLLVGIVIVVPPMGYVALRAHGGIQSFWAYYPTFFQVDLAQLDGYTGSFTPAHLWFILYLLLFSLISLPLFRATVSGGGKGAMSRVGTQVDAHPYLLWLAVVPIYFTRLTGLPYPNPLFFWLFFVYGYLMLAEPRLDRAIDHNKYNALLIGLATMRIYLALKAANFPLDDYTDIDLFYQLFLSVNNVAWLLIFLNFGRRFLNVRFSGWRYLNQAAYPLYLLHQTILVVLAFWFLQWEMAGLAQFVLVAVLAFGTTLLVYELVIRRFRYLQIALGVKDAY